jgi:hypothetical protein
MRNRAMGRLQVSTSLPRCVPLGYRKVGSNARFIWMVYRRHHHYYSTDLTSLLITGLHDPNTPAICTPPFTL